MMIKRLLILLFCIILLMPGVVLGNTNPGNEHILTVIHTGINNYFNVTAKPGQVISLEYFLFNRTEKEITNNIIVYDSKTAVNGGNIIMSPENMETEVTGSWFNENLSLITLKSGESKKEEMIITIPENCEPGVYTAIFGLYSIGDEDKLSTGNHEEVKLDIKSFYTSTLAIVISVGENPLRSVEFGDEVFIETDNQTGGCFLYVPVINKGNAYEFPVVNVEVWDKNQKIVYKGEVSMDIVYGKTESYACFNTADKILSDGKYTINANVRPSSGTGFMVMKKLFDLSLDKDFIERSDTVKLIEAASEVKESSGFIIISKNQISYIFISLGVLFILVFLVVLLLRSKKSS